MWYLMKTSAKEWRRKSSSTEAWEELITSCILVRGTLKKLTEICGATEFPLWHLIEVVHYLRILVFNVWVDTRHACYIECALCTLQFLTFNLDSGRCSLQHNSDGQIFCWGEGKGKEKGKFTFQAPALLFDFAFPLVYSLLWQVPFLLPWFYFSLQGSSSCTWSNARCNSIKVSLIIIYIY
jgi:hypothetical protein